MVSSDVEARTAFDAARATLATPHCQEENPILRLLFSLFVDRIIFVRKSFDEIELSFQFE